MVALTHILTCIGGHIPANLATALGSQVKGHGVALLCHMIVQLLQHTPSLAGQHSQNLQGWSHVVSIVLGSHVVSCTLCTHEMATMKAAEACNRTARDARICTLPGHTRTCRARLTAVNACAWHIYAQLRWQCTHLLTVLRLGHKPELFKFLLRIGNCVGQE